MIVADRKPIEEILDSIKDYKKIMLMGCGGCVTICFSGGAKAVGLLASQIKIARKQQGNEIEIIECTPERQCEYEFIDEFKPARNDPYFGNRGDAGQRLAAKAQGGDGKKVVLVGDLAGGVLGYGEPQLIR